MAACAQFFFDEDPDSPTLANRLTLSDDQYEKVRVAKDAAQAMLERHLRERSGRPVRFWIQGSYKNGTMVRPVRKGEEFDVDLGAYIEWPTGQAGFSPREIKTWSREALEEFARRRVGAEVEAPPKDRCERVNIDREFHLDVPTYHLDPDRDTRQLATQADTWEASDPKALQVWFLEATEQRDRDQIKRVIKYLKAWAALKWPDVSSRPNSTSLMILATCLCPNDEPDDVAFGTTVARCCEHVDQHDTLANPVDTDEDVLQLDGEQFQLFRTRLHECNTACRQALERENPQEAAVSWGEVFEHLFPPMRERVEAVDNVANLPAIYLRPRLRAQVFSRNPRRYLAAYTDDFVVTKGCDIEFAITNEAEIPLDATVTWVVRNQGAEASKVNDFGHMARGVRRLAQEEITQYTGTHYMDCIVSRPGQFLGMSSIKVTISDNAYQRPPARPWYNRFR